MRKRTSRLAEPPADFIDADFEVDDYPRRPIHPLRVWFRQHRRWVKSLHPALRFGVLAAWLLGLPAAFVAGVFYGVIWRAILGY